MTNATKERKLFSSWDTYDVIENEILFWLEEENPDDLSEEAIRENMYENPEVVTHAWDIFVECLDDEYFSKYSVYKVEGSRMGWRNLSGEALIEADNSIDFLRKVLPNCEYTLKIYKETDNDILEIVCYHHDSPMGESYTVTPIVYVWEMDRAELDKKLLPIVKREFMDRIKEEFENSGDFNYRRISQTEINSFVVEVLDVTSLSHDNVFIGRDFVNDDEVAEVEAYVEDIIDTLVNEYEKMNEKEIKRQVNRDHNSLSNAIGHLADIKYCDSTKIKEAIFTLEQEREELDRRNNE